MSRFWDELSKEHKAILDGGGIGNFRNTIATRYFTQGESNDVQHLISMYNRMRNSIDIDLDDPGDYGAKTVVIDGHSISQDLINSFYELHSIKVDFKSIKTITEIGAGYGRLAYVILKKYPHIKYTIYDIEPALTLARTFLSKHVPEATVIYKTEADAHPTDLTIAVSILSELTDVEVEKYIKMFWQSRYVYIRDWRSYRNNMDNVNATPHEKLISLGWRLISHADDILVHGFAHSLFVTL